MVAQTMWCCNYNGRKVEQGSRMIINLISNSTDVSGLQTLDVDDKTVTTAEFLLLFNIF